MLCHVLDGEKETKWVCNELSVPDEKQKGYQNLFHQILLSETTS